ARGRPPPRAPAAGRALEPGIPGRHRAARRRGRDPGAAAGGRDRERRRRRRPARPPDRAGRRRCRAARRADRAARGWPRGHRRGILAVTMPMRVAITAAAGGFGLTVARAFAAQGAVVHVCDLDAGAVRAAADEGLHATEVDVAELAALDHWIDGVLAACGGLDVLVNNA